MIPSKLKIYNQSMNGTYTSVPIIILKGQCLNVASFKAGEYAEVICDGDKITLTKTKAPVVKVENLWEIK